MSEDSIPVAADPSNKHTIWEEQLIKDVLSDSSINLLENLRRLNEDGHVHEFTISFRSRQYTGHHRNAISKALVLKGYSCCKDGEYDLRVGLIGRFG